MSKDSFSFFWCQEPEYLPSNVEAVGSIVAKLRGTIRLRRFFFILDHTTHMHNHKQTQVLEWFGANKPWATATKEQGQKPMGGAQAA